MFQDLKFRPIIDAPSRLLVATVLDQPEQFDYADGVKWMKDGKEEDWGTHTFRHYKYEVFYYTSEKPIHSSEYEKSHRQSSTAKSTSKKRSKTVSICYKRVFWFFIVCIIYGCNVEIYAIG
ncbi:hypothetical protein B0H13DRAFT_1862938 [Mycena leptocephala]|nr:hypothetical protein B0H13DRAFT_1862938 [Mycena leptocephala]